MNNQYSVNHLLSVSRITERFYHDVTGEESIFKNPGVALRSFVVAKCLQYDYVSVDDNIIQLVEECEKFEIDNFFKLDSLLMKQSEELIKQSASIDPRKRAALTPEINKLSKLIASLTSIVDRAENIVLYRQNLFDIQDSLSVVKGLISELSDPPKEYA